MKATATIKTWIIVVEHHPPPSVPANHSLISCGKQDEVSVRSIDAGTGIGTALYKEKPVQF